MEPANDKPRVTNLDYLKKLSRGNDQFMKEMIRIFLLENPHEVEALEKAISERDFRLINSTAHKLRSTVPFVGIDKLIASEITQIEQLALARAGDPLADGPARKPARFLPTDRELIERIGALFKRIKTVCSRAYDELGPIAGT